MSNIASAEGLVPYTVDIRIARKGESVITLPAFDPRDDSYIPFPVPGGTLSELDFVFTVRDGPIGVRRMEKTADLSYSRLTSPNAPLSRSEGGAVLGYLFTEADLDAALISTDTRQNFRYQLRWFPVSLDSTAFVIYEGRFDVIPVVF